MLLKEGIAWMFESIFMVKVAWLSFMMADMARLLFRAINKVDPFSIKHRHEKYGVYRIIFQIAVQNVGYLISLALLYLFYKDTVFLVLLTCYALVQVLKIIYQAKTNSAYVVTPTGHNINNFIVKPLRMVILIMITWRTSQLIWVFGLIITAIKWLFTITYEAKFDVPNWYHSVLIVVSAGLIFLIFPFEIGVVKADYARAFFSAVPSIYVSIVGFLGVLYQLILGEENGEKKERKLRHYFTWGIILNFSYTLVLTILCIVGIVSFGDKDLALSADALFNASEIQANGLKNYLLFGTIFSLGWFLSFFLMLNTYIMLQHTGMFPNRIDPEKTALYSRAKSLSTEGLTYRQIADKLNQDEIFTSSTKQWTKEEVRKMLKNQEADKTL